jgi:hypothetical protein
MGQHTLLFVEAVFLGEVAALRRPTQFSKDIFNGIFQRDIPSACERFHHFMLLEGGALTAENFHGVHARECSEQCRCSEDALHRPHGTITAQRGTAKGLISELGHSRHFELLPFASGPPRSTDIVRLRRRVPLVPTADLPGAEST